MATYNAMVIGNANGLYKESATYAGARGASSADAAYTHLSRNEKVGTYGVQRGFLPALVDIPAGSTITSVVAKLYYDGTRNTTYDDVSQFTVSTQTDPTALAVADFDNLTLDSPTLFAESAAWSTWSAVAFTSITFNAAGIAYFNSVIGTYAKIVARASRDIANTTPAESSYLSINWANETGKEPYFEITYNLPATSGFFSIL